MGKSVYYLDSYSYDFSNHNSYMIDNKKEIEKLIKQLLEKTDTLLVVSVTTDEDQRHNMVAAMRGTPAEIVNGILNFGDQSPDGKLMLDLLTSIIASNKIKEIADEAIKDQIINKELKDRSIN